MKILLVKPAFARLYGSRVYHTLPLGLMYVAGMLRDRGHEVRIFHDDVSNPTPLPQGRVVMGQMQAEPVTAEILAPYVEVLESWRPDCVGISYTTADVPAAHAYAKAARRRGIRTVGGGVHASLLPDEECEHFDAVVVGEGDNTSAKVAFEDFDTVRFCAEPTDNLDRYLPARDCVIGGERYDPFLRGMVQTQRGCPYACAYCAAPKVFGTKVRTRRSDAVRSEIDGLVAQGVNHGRIIDDSFGVVRAHGLGVCEALAGSGFRWIADAALQNMDEELAEAMVAGGCEKVCMGVESATPRIRELSGKHLEEGDPERALAMLQGKGMARVAFYLMIGFPGETVAEMRATLAWGKRLHEAGAEIALSLCQVYPGTKLWEMVPEGQRPRQWGECMHQSGRGRLGAVSEAQWQEIQEEAQQNYV
jgi:anaerobic magnesium-protoporphyrin IX monomethyl ester cyclase